MTTTTRGYARLDI